MLLQWLSFFRSPSRNQMPSVIVCAVSGVAVELDTKKASEARAANVDSIQKRRVLMFPNFTFNTASMQCRLVARCQASLEMSPSLPRQKCPLSFADAVGGFCSVSDI